MDNMTNLNILLDYFVRTVSDLKTIRNAMIQNDYIAFRALYRYFRHTRDFSCRYDSSPIRRETARAICDIMESYIQEHRTIEED